MKHIVGFSGGIDSQAAARYVLNRYQPEDVIILNSDAGKNEHPLTTEHIDWYSANVHPVVHVDAIASDLWETEGQAEAHGLDPNMVVTFVWLAKWKHRFPSRKAQFCTEILKLKPQRRWVRENFGPTGPYAGEDYCRYTGVRRDESDARKRTPFVWWDKFFDCEVQAPIADFTKQMCFDYVKAHGEQINRLYSLGFDRVGCAPCVNSKKHDILNWLLRSPDMIDKVRDWENEVGSSFFPPNIVPGQTVAFVDDVVAWAKGKRGQNVGSELLPIITERPACESKYGLCE